MSTRTGYKRCRRLVRDLSLPQPFSVPALVESMAARRGRPIQVLALPSRLTINACGVWVSTASSDVIFVEDKTTPLHHDHIVLHEIGHMLCDHRGTGGTADGRAAGLARFLPDLAPELVERLLMRTGYTTEEEQDAELVASLIRTRARSATTAARPGVLGELEAALGIGSRRV